MTTLAGYMFGQFSLMQYLEFFLRIVVASICGAIIGYERTKRLKEAGVRTHVIVCCAAALTIIISKYAFSDLISPTGLKLYGTNGTDPARLAAQIISGVSFLGAGMIFRTGNSTHGLTTAAGVWATACIGLAIGAGMYVLGVFSTLIIAAIQIIMHRFTIGTDSMVPAQVNCTVQNPDDFQTAINVHEKKRKIQVASTKVMFSETGDPSCQLSLRVSSEMTVHELIDLFRNIDGVHVTSCEIGK